MELMTCLLHCLVTCGCKTKGHGGKKKVITVIG